MADPDATSLMPVQAPPIKRPDLVLPHQTVDVVNGDPEDLFYARIYLLHGANYNDPAAFNHAAITQRGERSWRRPRRA